MKTYFRGFLIPIVFIVNISSFIVICDICAFNINPEIANIGYWYEDSDIKNVITSRLGDSSYIAPAVHNAVDLIMDVANAAITEAGSGKPALIPVNLGNNHWTALAIRKTTNGKLIVFYNDSFGGNIGGSSSESGQYIAAILDIVPDAEIIDLQVRQQNDGSSCGAFTAENLIALAGLTDKQLNVNDAKAVLENIKDAKAIRLLHLNGLYAALITKEEAADSVVIKNNVEVISNSALHVLSCLKNVTIDRLGYLHLASNVSGFGSGDEAAVYGVWIQGNLGNGVYKAKDFGVFKGKTGSITVGADSKIDEDTTLGIATSFGQVNINSDSHNNAAYIKSLIGSLYGSFVADEKLVINGSIELARLIGKTEYQSILAGKNSFKLKGSSFGANIEASYYTSAGSFIFIPSISAVYGEVKFAKPKQGNSSFSKINIKKFSIDPAIRITIPIELKCMNLIPELSARGSYALYSRASNIAIKNANGVLLADNPQKIGRTSCNFGANITLAGLMVESTIGFEAILQNKYRGQTGYIKLRINI